MFGVPFNLWPLLAATLAGMIIGFLWYSPWLFGNMWMKAQGLTKKDCEDANMIKSIVGQFFVLLIMAYVLYGVLALTAVSDIYESLLMAFWLWIGFMATLGMSAYLWDPKRKIHLTAMDAGHNLVVLLSMAAILFQFG